jgi:hypothetical protein
VAIGYRYFQLKYGKLIDVFIKHVKQLIYRSNKFDVFSNNITLDVFGWRNHNYVRQLLFDFDQTKNSEET